MAQKGRSEVQDIATKILVRMFAEQQKCATTELWNQVLSRVGHALLEASKDIPAAIEIDGEDGKVYPIAELRGAYFWECPKCSADNWEYSVCGLLSAERQQDIAVKLGLIEEWQSWDADDIALIRTYAPGKSRCESCGIEVACAYENTVTGELNVGGNIIEDSPGDELEEENG